MPPLPEGVIRIDEREAIERLQYFGQGYFSDAVSEAEAINDLKELFRGDPEFRAVARSAFALALSGEVEGSEIMNSVLNDFNRWVESEKEALAYLTRIRDALLEPADD